MVTRLGVCRRAPEWQLLPSGLLDSIVHSLDPSPDMMPSLVVALKAKGRRLADRTMMRRFTRRHGYVVTGGPFSGMRYVERSRGSALLPKLLGTYECELHEAVEAIPATDYRVVVDVGCAEGYYAVGLARMLPNAIMYAFDIDPEARQLCSELATRNGVADRVRIESECTPVGLDRILDPRALIVCDCEGYEEKLLSPDEVPGLKHVDVIVELHDFIRPGMTELILSRFRETHAIEVLDSQPREEAQFPVLREFPFWYRRYATMERRPPGMRWAVMQAMSREPES